MFQSFAIFPSHCATPGSAERLTCTYLATRPAHNLLIALSASPPTILFQFEQTIAFQPVHLFSIYIYKFLFWIRLNMFRFWASSICLFSISSAEPSIKTFLVAWPEHDLLITLPASPTHIFFFTDYYIFASLLFIYFWVWTFLYMFHSHVSLICYLSTPVCSHRLSRATMDRHPKGSALLSWPAKSKLIPHSFVDTHSCVFHSSPQNPHYPIRVPPTSHLNWSDETPLYPNSGIKTLELTPLKAASLYFIQPFTPSQTPPHTLIYKCLNHLNYLFLPGQPTKRDRQYWAWMGDGMGGLPRALRKSHRGICNNPSI